MLDAPLWKPPSLAGAVALAELLAASRLELRCRWGRPRARARSPRSPHLHRFGFGGFAPLPPRFPAGRRLPVMRECAWYRVRNGFCGNAFASLRGSSCRAAARSSVTPLARIAAEGRASATASGGIPKGAQPSLASLCLLSAGQKVGARRGLSASKEKIIILIGVKRIEKSPPPPRRREKAKF